MNNGLWVDGAGRRCSKISDFHLFVCVARGGSRAGTTSRHFHCPAISRNFSSRHFAGFQKVFVSFIFWVLIQKVFVSSIQKGFRIFWVRIRKVSVSLDPKRFSYLHPKGFRINIQSSTIKYYSPKIRGQTISQYFSTKMCM